MPGVTQSCTGTSGDKVPSPSAITTSASHGVVLAPGAGSRSHGSVRRFSTICGSRPLNAPTALAGGKVDSVWSGGKR